MPRPSAVPEKSTTVRPPFVVRTLGAALRTVDRVSPRLAAAWTERLFLTPRRHPVPARERDWLAGARPGELRLDGRRLPTWSWGEGRPVVLAHGWEGRGSQLGAFVAPLVAAGRRVVAFDAPAHGSSPGRTTNLIEMSETIRALVESLGEPAAVVAHSFGAAATTVALRRPLALERAVYLSPAEDFAHFTNAFGAVLGLAPDLVERMQRRIEERFATPWASLRGREIAPGLAVPLLVVHDRDDLEVPSTHGDALAAAWPGARLVRTRGLGHRRILRDPDVVASAVDFLRATDEAPAEPTLAAAAAP